MSLSEVFRDNLRNALAYQGLTQKELAQKSGVHRITIHRILAGKHEPTLVICDALARALRLPPVILFSRAA